MRLRFQIKLWEVFLFLTAGTIAHFALAKASDLIAHLFVSFEVVFLAILIALIPSSHGGTRRFLTAFVGTVVVYEIFATDSYYSPFEVPLEHLWLLLAQQKPDVLNGPRPDALIAFRDTAHPVTGLLLGTMSGLLARALEPADSSEMG